MINRHLNILISSYPLLSAVQVEIERACDVITDSYRRGGKLLAAGNGGSAADADHIVAELMKGFAKKRPLDEAARKALIDTDFTMGGELASSLQASLPAISLSAHQALTTAFGNDCNPVLAFAQQVNGYGRKGDVFLAISTSGNSRNILYAAVAARSAGMKVIGLTGETGGELARFCDVCIKAPAGECFRIQEMHLPIYHTICLTVEENLFEI